MYNDLFSIGPLSFNTYGLMTAIGIFSAYFWVENQAKKRKLKADSIMGLLISCLVAGYGGSKLLYFLTILPQILKEPSLLADSLSTGWVVFGGILGGLFGGWVYCRVKGLPAGDYFDISMPAVALAQGFGRLGCFFAGCCYGVETDSAFSIMFSHSEFAPNHVRLVPTQLISSVGDFLLFAILVWYDYRGKKHSGETTALYLILYSAGRFLVEFWRGDLIRGAVGPLSTSQFIGLLALVAGILLMAWMKRGREAAR